MGRHCDGAEQGFFLCFFVVAFFDFYFFEVEILLVTVEALSWLLLLIQAVPFE